MKYDTIPKWIRAKVSDDDNSHYVKEILHKKGLNSVCVSADCPNKGECWKKKHVTFMILGDVCTRNCFFCNIKTGKTQDPDDEEPRRIAEAVKELGIKYVVITSVTRDDLTDKGAGQFIRTMEEIKKLTPEVKTELLIPDFNADPLILKKIASSGADVIGHNIEMPAGLYPGIRPKADYNESIEVLKTLKKISKNTPIKSSIMVGLGEGEEDITRTLQDLKDAGVDIVYIGQYLSPTKENWPVKKYYTPDEFSFLEAKTKQMGFKFVFSGPLVRSSYRALEAYLQAC